MTTQIIRAAEVTRPTPDPLRSSVLDHATVVTNTSFGLRNNEGLWPSYNCIDTLVPTSICPDPLASKTFAVAEWTPALEFAMHGGVRCKMVGLDKADMVSELDRVFALNEGKGVEQVLLYNRFVATDSDAVVQWDAPLDLTPGVGISLSTALALVEGHAAAVYAGAPTIHMPRAAASLLNERIVWEGDKAYTRSGSKVAFGGGYDSADVPDGTFDIFATGEVYVERSETVSLSSVVIPGTTDVGSDPDSALSDNTMLAIAERMYRVAVDCFVVKATGTAWT